MATTTRAERKNAAGLSRDQLVGAYKTMLLSRRLDDKEIQLKGQNKIFFQISGAGHEAILLAAGFVLRPSYDWFYTYYRDRALCLQLGMTEEEMLLSAVGAAADPNSGGRQMPSHWGHKKLNIVSNSSPTGTQFLQAAGSAEAIIRAKELGITEGFEKDEVVFCSSGDGTTSEGEFWESMNAACNMKLPIVYLIEDNGYAISVPVEVNTAGGSISKLVSSFPCLQVEEVDGCDLLASYGAMQRAVEYARSRKGPALVHAHVIRPYSHSLSDQETKYRPPSERDADAARDPVTHFPKWLVAEGYATEEDITRIKEEVEAEVTAATDAALVAPQPGPETIFNYVYSPDVDPTSEQFDTEDDPQFSGNETTMVDLLNACMKDEMRRDEKILIFGEDVADVSREKYLEQVKGKGGVFKATQGLQTVFGSQRVFNTPIAEAAIVGRGAGMATRGLKPVVEIQFFDYIWPAMMQIRDELASLRWRSYNGFSAPMVIRVTIGGYLNGGAIYHSQCGESIFTHIPGLRVVFPSNALDACGLLRTSIRSDDPVLFLEHKKLYREAYNRSPHPGPDYTIPFGKAKIAKTGSRLTIVTYGALVQKSLQASLLVEQRNPDHTVEVIDLRTLSPYDWEAIRASVEKTSRVMVVHEDTLSWGYGAEISARVASELFSSLDAPVGRIGALDTWVGYHPNLEAEILPQVDNIVAEADRILSY